jgi:uncharacterized protein
MAAKFELFKDRGGNFRFHPKAANGEIIASGQGYKSKAAAEKGIESIKANAAYESAITPRAPGHSQSTARASWRITT